MSILGRQELPGNEITCGGGESAGAVYTLGCNLNARATKGPVIRATSSHEKKTGSARVLPVKSSKFYDLGVPSGRKLLEITAPVAFSAP